MSEKPMPMCPFCNRETTYVVRNSNGTFHCNNCGGDFAWNGTPIIWPEEDGIEPNADPSVMTDEEYRNWEAWQNS